MNDTRKPQGFAALSPERRREISRQGGLAAQASGKGHRFTTEEAREAGRKGGQAVAAKRGTAGMSELGRMGGKARHDQPIPYTLTPEGLAATDHVPASEKSA